MSPEPDQDQIQQLTAPRKFLEIPTPRTDAIPSGYKTALNFARQLEREAQQLTAQLSEANQKLADHAEDWARLEKVASLFENCRNLFRFNGSIEKPNPDSTFREAIDIARSKASTKEGA